LKLHAAIYRSRPDAGATLLNTTTWSPQLAAMGESPPTLYDEQARHIGTIAAPVAAGDVPAALAAVAKGANIAIFGSQCLCIGMTRDRVVFNAELFDKCAMAFVVARSSGLRVRTVPSWVRFIAGGRLKKDQKRAAQSYLEGRIPAGMNDY
jgi:ribulose-5-phosphate 4-epimerase/fuculose-1-phosphate aldolase